MVVAKIRQWFIVHVPHPSLGAAARLHRGVA
jgi:hypothetical protein